MAVQLKILWEGEVRGLTEHRLSLSAFGEPLMNLLAAYRRIASNIMSDAIDNAELASSGRLAREAKQLDIEIIQLEAGSTGVSAICTFQPAANIPQSLAALPHVAGMELLFALDQESRGNLRHVSVRKFLNSLPSGLRRQNYTLRSEMYPELTVEIAELRLSETPRDMPYLAQYIGNIMGVGFEPGKNEIRIRSEFGQVVLSATPEQVDQAIELRNSTIRAIAVTGKPARLLRLQAEDAPTFEANDEQVERYIFQRWDELLRRLAQ